MTVSLDPAADSTVNPLIRKLEASNSLNDADRARLTKLSRFTRLFEPKQVIIDQHDPPKHVHLVLEGFALRQKILADGKRQIMAILLPGDFCDLHVAILGQMDHAIVALTPCKVAEISTTTIRDLTENHPRIIRALWWATLVDEATLREWLVNLGQRQATERMAHLFCEMLLRLRTVGLADEDSYAWPLRQIDLGDLLALTSVHANRTLQALRAEGLIVLKQRHLSIPDVERLMAYCQFDAAYLHLGSHGPSRLDPSDGQAR